MSLGRLLFQKGPSFRCRAALFRLSLVQLGTPKPKADKNRAVSSSSALAASSLKIRCSVQDAAARLRKKEDKPVRVSLSSYEVGVNAKLNFGILGP